MARSIVDNINTWIYLLVNHPETAAHIEQTAPERVPQEPVLDLERGQFTWRTMREPTIKAARVQQLQKRWFYCRSYGRVWKGRTADVTPTWLKTEWPVITPYVIAETAPVVSEAEPPQPEPAATGAT